MSGGGSAEEPIESRERFRWWLEIPTRWMDNDVYGHVNNVQYYSYFDTAVNTHLIREAGLDIHTSPIVGLVVSTQCQFKKSIVFPEKVDAGIRIEKIGRSSVSYSVGLFREGDAEIAALGRFVHVYVERTSQTPVPVPEAMRAAMEKLIL